MKIPSTMPGGHKFSQVPKVEIQRAQFDRSFGYKTTFDAGYLIPFYADEVLPGDTFALKVTAFARLATPIKPVMDNMTMDTFFFFVPNRLVWDNWVKFNGEQDNPGDSVDFTIPRQFLQNVVSGTLHDYFGIPVGNHGSFLEIDALHFRAYNLIWNEFFRDQNMQDSVVVDKDDGTDDPADYVLLRRGKRHDYFTSCLPWPQKGDAVSLPLGTTAPVLSNLSPDDQPLFASVGGVTGGQLFAESNVEQPTVGVTSPVGIWDTSEVLKWDVPNLFTDLTNATAATINELRQAFQIQKMLEKDARGGTRYTEVIRAHFGVTSPDARLQRPEYLGGGSTPVNISPIAQTTPTDIVPDITVQGNLAGIGTVQFSGHGFAKSFTEHGVLVGLVSVRADLTYQQGLDRMWSRQTRFDYFWPSLSHIGEQAVLRGEIFSDGTAANDAVVFGYQERFAEYRYKPSLVTGKFRSGLADTLDVWHLAEEFSVAPVLGETFIQVNPPIDRVIAVVDEPHFLFDSLFRLKCARPMPLYGVPGLIDHF